MKTLQIYLLFGFMILPFSNFLAQGCSDAGFCTVNSLKPHTNDSVFIKKNYLKAGISVGDADRSITTFGSYLEYGRILNAKFGINAKITSLSQSGNTINTFGLSDIFLTSTYRPKENLTFTLGTKIPLTDGNSIKNGQFLPMDYQSSLGTLDLIAGIGYEIKKLQLTVALQQPLTQSNNQFISENLPENSVLRGFQTTNDFKRSGDLLFRASYPFKIGNKLQITPGLLNIYHLSKDKFTSDEGVQRTIEGSEGLTINGNLFFDYKLNESNGFQLSIGVPFLVRDVRPDGLTRSFVANLEYGFTF